MKRLLLCAALIAWSGMASAIVYKWVDAQGKVQYGDRPPDGVHAEVMEGLGTHVSRPAPTRSTDSPPTARPASASVAPPPPVSDTAKKAIDSQVAEVRQQQCAEAQDRFKKYIESRRLYKTDENGERVYLTSEEVDSARADAKRDVDAICGSTS